MIDIDGFYIQQKFTNDLPVFFNGLNIHPIKMDKFLDFSFYSSVLLIKKNRIPDPKIISMTYLSFLYYMIFESEDKEKANSIQTMLLLVLSYCLQDENPNVAFSKEKKNVYLHVNGNKFDSNSFDDLSKIIMFQNNPYYDDKYIDPELEEDLALADKLRSKGAKSVSIENQMIAVSIGIGCTFKDVLNMTIRKFRLYMHMIESKLSYTIAKQAEMSGMVKFEKEIRHYLQDYDEGSLDDKVIDADSVKSKINSANI